MDQATFLQRAKPVKEIPVPELEGSVYLKSLSWKERLEVEESIKADSTSAALTLVAAALCTKDGKRLFAPDQLDALAECDSRILIRLCNAARELNEFSEQDIEELKKS